MNSKERVRIAVEGGAPDRVPLGHYIIDCDTAGKVLGRKTYFRNRIRSTLAIWYGRRDELVQSLKEDTVELFRKLDVFDIITFKDAVSVPPKDYEPLRPKRIAEDTWEDKHGRVYKAAFNTNDMTCVRDPAREEFKDYGPEDFCGAIEAKPPDPSTLEVYNHVMTELGGDFYVGGMSGGIVGMVLLDGMENGLMHYALHTEAVKAATERRVRYANAMDQHFIREEDDGTFVEQDQATSQGPMISPETYREIVFPAMKSRISNIKSFGKQVIMHNCGNNWAHVPMMIEAGVQCYQSLQTGCMDMKALKEEFGDRIAFWGGVSVESLVAGTPDDVRRDVRYAMEHGAPGGGFILGPSHSIAFGTKYENFMAMLDEYDRLKGKYC